MTIFRHWIQGPFFALVAFAAACGGSSSSPTAPSVAPPTVPAPAIGVFLEPSLLGVGESGRGHAFTELGQELSDVSWSSSNPAVAAVRTDGVVLAIGSGSAEIRAQRLGQSAASPVRVIGASDITSFFFAFLNGSLDALVGQPVGLTPRLTMGNTTYDPYPPSRLAWQSSNPGVVGVSAGGDVTIVAPGSATVTATFLGLTASVRITATTLDHDLFTIQSESASGLFAAGGRLSFSATAGYSLLTAPVAAIRLTIVDQSGKTVGSNPIVTVGRGAFQTVTLRDEITVPAGTQSLCTSAGMTTSAGAELYAFGGCLTIRPSIATETAATASASRP